MKGIRMALNPVPRLAALLVIAALLGPQPASGMLIIRAEQVGNDVVFSYGGLGQSLDLSGLISTPGFVGILGAVAPSSGRIWSINILSGSHP